MIFSFLGGVVVVVSHIVTGHAVHRWLFAHGVPLPQDAGAWAGTAFAVYLLFF
jgi:hypothetical protein